MLVAAAPVHDVEIFLLIDQVLNLIGKDLAERMRPADCSAGADVAYGSGWHLTWLVCADVLNFARSVACTTRNTTAKNDSVCGLGEQHTGYAGTVASRAGAVRVVDQQEFDQRRRQSGDIAPVTVGQPLEVRIVAVTSADGHDFLSLYGEYGVGIRGEGQSRHPLSASCGRAPPES